MRSLKMQDMNLADQTAGHEIAGQCEMPNLYSLL